MGSGDETKQIYSATAIKSGCVMVWKVTTIVELAGLNETSADAKQQIYFAWIYVTTDLVPSLLDSSRNQSLSASLLLPTYWEKQTQTKQTGEGYGNLELLPVQN